MIGRRQFITLLGGATAWPLAARAQRTNMPVIGYLDTGPPERISSALSDLRRGLNDAGYVDGRNVAILSPRGTVGFRTCRGSLASSSSFKWP